MVASSTVLPVTSGVRACLVVLAGKLFAIDVRAAREIVVFEGSTPVPRGPGHVLGVANLRGTVMPILDIQPLLGLPGRRGGERTSALVVSSVYESVAIAVDRVLGLESFTGVVPFSDAARGEHGEFALGLLPRADTFITLLNVAGIIEALRRDGWRNDAAPRATGR